MLNLFKRQASSCPQTEITAVISGRLLPLSEVRDEVFAQKMLGDGAAIQPEGEIVAAPCDGKITMLYPTLHAFGLVNPDGLEILVHIGIDTVSLQGKGFKAYVQEGDTVKRGDKIIRFDSYLMNQKEMDMTTMTLFPNADAFQLDIQRSGFVKKGQSRIATYQIKEGKDK
ncbi:PTS sugar transporter subunit IIA [Holdemania filiformis]|uniref:PTS sugar transporter subunit IIA n=1 Tax=Holdemania filiformis TaxID=61171 RepID=UPI002674A090|nr:PTS glucose transporter subunit IIA [Holdemania filiformis]